MQYVIVKNSIMDSRKRVLALLWKRAMQWTA